MCEIFSFRLSFPGHPQQKPKNHPKLTVLNREHRPNFPKSTISSCNPVVGEFLLVSRKGSLLFDGSEILHLSLIIRYVKIHHYLQAFFSTIQTVAGNGISGCHQQYQFQPGSHIGIGRIVFFEGLQTWRKSGGPVCHRVFLISKKKLF